MKYVMRITETLSRIVIVDAEDCVKARNKAESAHTDGLVVLDYEDYDGCEVEAIRIACPGDLERYEEVGVN